MPIQKTTAFAGEIGLSGEVRPPFRFEQRLAEAEKLGFERLLISDFTKLNSNHSKQLSIQTVRKIDDLGEFLF
jgi:DNA repair protein RadA/Sms